MKPNKDMLLLLIVSTFILLVWITYDLTLRLLDIIL